MDLMLEAQAEMLVSKIKHYLITTMGLTADEANTEEFYRAFSLTLREEIMINWTATTHTIKNTQARVLNYLCMEYMPGRFLGNNIISMNAMDLVKVVLKKMNRTLDMTINIEQDVGIGNGGLGRLASCLLDSLATQQYPAVGYGLRYQYGIFDQEVWDGVQVERPDNWLLHENPWEFRRDDHAVSVFYSGRPVSLTNKKGEEVQDLAEYEEVRALSYDMPIIGYKEAPDFNVVTLRLWTTKESPRNFQLQRYNAGHLDQAAENTSLTDVLYPNDNNEVGKRIRLKQEFLLASASIQDIILHHLRRFPDMSSFVDKVRIQINDTHPAIVIPELIRILLRNYDFGWQEALEVAKTCCSYTNHTIMKEALEEWNESRLRYLLPRQYQVLERMNLEFCNAIRKKFPNDEERVRRVSIIEEGQVRMANLCIFGTHRVNGVAALHTEILKEAIFKDFYEMYPENFVNITNGVTQRRWLLVANPKLAEFISKRIGKGWTNNFKLMEGLAKFASDPETQQEFLNIKRENKKALVSYLIDRNPIRDVQGKVIAHSSSLDESALFDVHIKRIHEYKRQLMNALHVLMIYQELKSNPSARKVKRQVLFGGKAAPGYQLAKDVIHLIYCLSRKINSDPSANHALKVAFIENYNISKAQLIIPAADLSEQISTAGMEASGTGNMKLSMNGALTIGTEDGANIEMHEAVTDQWWPFSFGHTAEQNAEMRSKHNYNPWDVYMHHAGIRQAIDTLRDRSLCDSDGEHEALTRLYNSLFTPQNGDSADRFFVLSDLQSYYETQKKVEALYEQPGKWAEYAIHNMAAMGRFSSDESVHNYAKLVWDLQPCPVDKAELARVRDEYSEHDRCRIIKTAS
jgi:starch phosphorylase